MNTQTQSDQDRLMELAIGRVFRIMSRPCQEGDVEDYERCRSIIMTIAETQGGSMKDYVPNYARDRLKGAAGD